MSDPVARALENLANAVQTLEGLLGEALVVKVKEPPNNRPKLTKREVSNIRSLKRSGYTQREIADIYDCNPATVSRIVRHQYHK